MADLEVLKGDAHSLAVLHVELKDAVSVGRVVTRVARRVEAPHFVTAALVEEVTGGASGGWGPGEVVI